MMTAIGFFASVFASAGLGIIGCALFLRKRFEGIEAENAQLLVGLQQASRHLRVAGHLAGARAANDVIDTVQGGGS